jgi:hypothetical protein
MQPDVQLKHGKTRRTVLQASLAAPVVLTVSSASAATASFARCLANSETPANAFFAQGSDGWFRQQVPVVELWAQGSSRGYFFLDQVKNVYVSIEPPYAALSFGAALDPGWKEINYGSRWALVWFDKATTTQYSKITLQQPSGSTATTMSCYGSFNKA